MTTPGEATVHRYVSDGRMADGVNRDAMTRMNHPLLWSAVAIVSFASGFTASYRENLDSLPYYRGEVIGIATGWGLAFVAIMATAVLLGLALARTTNRRRMQLMYPRGSETEVELAEQALVLRRPTGTRSIPYAMIRAVQLREHVLWVIVRGRPVTEPLPAGLLPPDALDTIRARSLGAVPLSTPSGPTGPVRQVVVPQHWARHVASTTLWRTVAGPRFWARLGLGVLVSIPIALAGGRVWLALAPSLALLSLAIAHTRTRQSVATALPPGSVASTEALGDRLVARYPRWSRDIPYSEIRRTDVRGDIVFFEMTTPPPLLVLARDLVPDGLIDRHRNAPV